MSANTSTANDGGPGGTIVLKANGSVLLEAATISATVAGGQEPGGEIAITSQENVTLGQGTVISALNQGKGPAGDIKILAEDTLLLDSGSIISTRSASSQGGDITLKAESLIHLRDSTVESSVFGGAETVGGNIEIDPLFVIVQHSNIRTTATEGDGGRITIVGNVVLVDPLSDIDVSSQSGSSGIIDIQAPIQNLKGTIGPLPQNILALSKLYTARCAAQKNGQFSSLTVDGRDGVPPAPGGLLTSPLGLPSTGQPQIPLAAGREFFSFQSTSSDREANSGCTFSGIAQDLPS